MSGVSAFLWQAALLLLVAYFLGAWIGCLLRRMMPGAPKVAMESATASGVAATAAVASGAVVAAGGARKAELDDGAKRFGLALEGDDRVAPPRDQGADPGSQTPPALKAPLAPDKAGIAATQPAEPALAKLQPRQADPVTFRSTGPSMPPSEPEHPQTPPATKFTYPMSAADAAAAAYAARLASRSQEAAAAQGSGAPVPSESVAAKLETLAPPAGRAATARPTDLPASAGTGGQATVAARIADDEPQAPLPVAPLEAKIPDDLGLIEGITAADAAILKEAGVESFQEIAGWNADDVEHISNAIGDNRRIARENWIEQAQLLSSGGETAYARQARSGVTPALLAPRPPEPVASTLVAPARAPAQPQPVPASPAQSSPQDAIPPEAPPIEIEPVLQQAASEPEQIMSDDAAATAAAAAAAAAASVAVASAATAATFAPITTRAPADNAGPVPAGTSEASPVAPKVSERSAFAVRVRTPRHYNDDLQQIDGINAEIEKLLNEQGIGRLSQIADLSLEQQVRIDRLLGGMNRVKRENWVGQARRLIGWSDPSPNIATRNEASPPIDAAPLPDNLATVDPSAANARHNVRGLRSVRSEALVGANAVDVADGGDDLKRIRGVGVLIEKRLRAMGFSTYEQIGSWTQAEIDRVSQQLDFRGRIERENWIEQARILGSGGQTEFSRRIDQDDD